VQGQLPLLVCRRSKLTRRPTLITLTTTKAKRRVPPEPASRNSSDSLKRTREGSQGRSQSPAKRTRDGQIIEMPSSDDVEEVGENGEDIQELAEDGKLYFTIGSTS
jgi:hypothetical protein